jgi:serine phosphatase RsbU (regulator of sigma subunit)
MHANSVHDALAVGLGGVDCIVLDLASLDGYSDIDAVRHVRTGVSDYIPLLVLLDSADEATGEAALRFGAQGYLVKESLPPGQLARTVKGIVRQQQIAMADHELSLAQARARESVRLERGLSPQPLLRDGSISVASVYKTGRSRALLGGDFIDVVQLDERRARLVVGDVCGHGPDEAAVGVSLRAAWRALAISDTPIVPMIRTLESIFVQERHLPGLFVTMCMLDIDLAARTAELVIAGHPQPLLIDGEVVRPLADASGRAVGIGEEEWSSARVELPRGWTILAYTDGLIEGRTGDGPERLGEEGVQRLISEQVRLRPRWSARARELLNDIVDATEELNRGPLSDDVAMLLVGEGTRH